MTNPKDCKFYQDCSSNLCPLDPEMKSKVWCPEENSYDEICRNSEFAGLQFVRTQKKIARKVRTHKGERDDYFTFEMLNRNIMVKSSIRGVPNDSPDTMKDSFKWHSEKENLWLLRHHEISLKRLNELKLKGKLLSEKKKSIQKVPSDNTFSGMATSKGVITSLNPETSQKELSEIKKPEVF
jgi:hypothetical protein